VPYPEPMHSCRRESDLRYPECVEVEVRMGFLKRLLGLGPKPVDLKAILDRGCSHMQQGEFEKAIVDFTQLIECDPQLALAYPNRGYAYFATRQLDRAVADYNEAYRLDPKLVQAFSDKGLGTVKDPKLVDVVKDIKGAIFIDTFPGPEGHPVGVVIVDGAVQLIARDFEVPQSRGLGDEGRE
jgi:tetratricopeptide (TPR) repeat protein